MEQERRRQSVETPVKTNSFNKGDIVVMHFPFSDLTSSKKRPAFVLASLKGNDRLVCQITTNATIDDYSITLDNKDFHRGGLSRPSVIRPNKIFTADESILIYSTGSVKANKIKEVEDTIIKIIRQ